MVRPVVLGWVLLGCLWSASALRAQPLFLPPLETPIEQAAAHATADKLILVRVFREFVVQQREELYPVEVKVAKTVTDPATQQTTTVYASQTEMRTRTVSVAKPVYKQVAVTLDLAKVAATELSGARLDAAVLQTRLAKQGLVLIKMMGPALPKEYEVLFKPETIVIDLSSPDAQVPTAPLPPGGAPPPAPAEANLPVGADLPPQFRLASIDADGRYVLKVVQALDLTSTQYVTKTEIKLVDGKEIPAVVCVPVAVTERRESSHATVYPESAISAVTVDEKPLEDRHRNALRAREIPVVVSFHGKAVPSFWLQNIRPAMLVLTVPTSNPPGPMPPGPMPPEPMPPRPMPMPLP